MWRSVAERGELGTLQGVPCPRGSNSRPPWHFASGGRPLADLPWPSPPWWGLRGGRLVASVRRFALFPLVFGAFLEVPTSYRRDSFVVAKISLIQSQGFLFRQI